MNWNLGQSLTASKSPASKMGNSVEADALCHGAEHTSDPRVQLKEGISWELEELWAGLFCLMPGKSASRFQQYAWAVTVSHLLKVKIAAASLLSSHSHKNFSCGQPQTRPYWEGDSGKHSSSLARLTQYKILQGLRFLTPVFLSPSPQPCLLVFSYRCKWISKLASG